MCVLYRIVFSPAIQRHGDFFADRACRTGFFYLRSRYELGTWMDAVFAGNISVVDTHTDGRVDGNDEEMVKMSVTDPDTSDDYITEGEGHFSVSVRLSPCHQILSRVVEVIHTVNTY